MDTIVLDIETKNTFGDVGGKNFLEKLNISVVGLYSYQRDEYFCFGEDKFDTLKKMFVEPAILVGFSMNKFDLPIMNRELGLSLFAYPRIDISDEIELRTGRLVSLDSLGHLNLEHRKTHESLMAPELYRQGRIEELKTYCVNDVRITKKLYDLIKTQGFLIVPTKDSEPIKVEMDLDPQTLF